MPERWIRHAVYDEIVSTFIVWLIIFLVLMDLRSG